MRYRLIFLLSIAALLIFYSITLRHVGFVSEGSVPSSIVISEEAPAVVSSGGGGGGGGGQPAIFNFTINPDLIHAKIKQGETKRFSFLIKNTAKFDSEFRLELTDQIKDHTLLSEDSFILKFAETKKINVDFFAGEDEVPDTHPGRITVNSKNVIKNVNVIIEVLSKEPLFDIRSELERAELVKDEPIKTTITLTNMGDLENVDVLLEYFVEDFLGNEIKLGEETLAVKKFLELEREFSLPTSLDFGDYVFEVKLKYHEQVATSSNFFQIVEIRGVYFSPKQTYTLIIIIILALLFIIFFMRRRKEDEKKKAPKEKSWFPSIERYSDRGEPSI